MGSVEQNTVVMPLDASLARPPRSELGTRPKTVYPGVSVMWDNQDNALHTATYGNPETKIPDGKLNIRSVGASQQTKPVTQLGD